MFGARLHLPLTKLKIKVGTRVTKALEEPNWGKAISVVTHPLYLLYSSALPPKLYPEVKDVVRNILCY